MNVAINIDVSTGVLWLEDLEARHVLENLQKQRLGLLFVGFLGLGQNFQEKTAIDQIVIFNEGLLGAETFERWVSFEIFIQSDRTEL